MGATVLPGEFKQREDVAGMAEERAGTVEREGMTEAMPRMAKAAAVVAAEARRFFHKPVIQQAQAVLAVWVR